MRKTAKKICTSAIVAAMLVTNIQPVPLAQAASKSVTVTTQKELNAALKNKKVSTITIKTSKKETFALKKGTYQVNLVVDATNAKVVNKGNFKKI